MAVRAGLVAAQRSSADGQPGHLAQLPPAQLDRRRARRSASFFTASAAGCRRAGPDTATSPSTGRGVIFSGATREPVVARADPAALGAAVTTGGSGSTTAATASWASSRDGRLRAVVRACPAGRADSGFAGDVAFVGTSRVIPRFRALRAGAGRRAQPLRRARGGRSQRRDARAASSGRAGNQIFAIDWRARSRSRRASRFSRTRARRPAADATLFYCFTTRPRGRTTMSNDFRLLMIGAMYENGGNTTHRFLDGHPAAVRVPVRVSARAPRYVARPASLAVPGQVPLAGVRARRHARGRTTRRSSTRKCKVRARTPHVSKFRHCALRHRRR